MPLSIAMLADSASKKILSWVAANGAANVAVAPRGVNYRTVNTDPVGDLAVALSWEDLQIAPSQGTPVPTNSDVTALTGTALASTDFAIRNTNQHWFIRPTLGRRVVSVTLSQSPGGWNQAVGVTVYGMNTPSAAAGLLCPGINLPAGIVYFTLGSVPPVPGMQLGNASPVSGDYYYVPGMIAFPYVGICLTAAVAPGAGQLDTIYFYRSAS